MKKLFIFSAIAAFVMFATSAKAQLPSNPFNTNENSGTFNNVQTKASTKESITESPMYSDGMTGGEVIMLNDTTIQSTALFKHFYDIEFFKIG